MTLTDSEILELSRLCSAVVDGKLSAGQAERLEAWLRDSPAARDYYVKSVAQSASLHHYAQERQTDPIEPRTRFSTFSLRWALPLAAAVAVGVGLVWAAQRPASPSTVPVSVAQITGLKDCVWQGPALPAGARLPRGQRLEITKGVAEVTFDSGARVLLEAPASLDVNSAWDGTLRRGTVRATVPHEAIGFRISNPSVDVVDLGTEFTMIADQGGSAEVLVTKGEVEAAPKNGTDADSILLKERDSRRFASNGVSAIDDPTALNAALSGPIELERFTQDTQYARWAFSEGTGATLAAEATGSLKAPTIAISLVSDVPVPAEAAHITTHGSQAIHFGGQLVGKGSFPGISSGGTKTVGFWVRIPADAQLSNSFAMIAWSTSLPKLNYRPVHIGWNRNPNEGTLGAIRTDFGGGSAIGTTSLRDNKWHYVTVVFAPGQDDASPVQVKQYLDGHLESGSIVPGSVHAPRSSPEQVATIKDVIWLGCRVGITGPRRERFKGDLQELVIADRGLEPQEIVALMTTRRLPPQALVAQQ